MKPGLQLPPACLITTSSALAALVEELLSHDSIALDTEANSLYAYRERVCLIQLSTRKLDYVIDPLAIGDVSPLGRITADPQVQLVFHAAEYDVAMLKQDYGFEFSNIFDTMIAARVLGLPQFGLANLLQQYFGVEQDKRFQRADWGKRPLSPAQIEYAQLDTHFLLALRDKLYPQLSSQGAVEEAEELFYYAAQTRPVTHHFDEDGYWSINGTRRFNKRQMALLRELYLWREKAAQQQNIPRFKIITDDKLLRLVQSKPKSMNDLSRRRLLSPQQLRRYGRALLQALERGQDAPLPSRPTRYQLDPAILRRYDALKSWRKNRAAGRGVESDIIIRRETLWALAKAQPRTMEELATIEELGAWRRSQYGQEILQVLDAAEA